MQHQLLQVLQERPSGAMHHALGETGGAGGVHDVERVVEGKADGRRGGRADEHPVGPQARVAGCPRSSASHAGRAPRRPARSRECARGPRAPGPASRSPSRHSDSRRRRREPWADLAEAVEHPVGAEVGRAGRPDGAQAGRAEHGDHGLGEIGHESRNPVSGRDSFGRQGRRHRAHLLVQLAITDLPLAALLVPEHQGRSIVVIAQQVFGEVEPGAGEPPGPQLRIRRRHPVEPNDHRVPRIAPGPLLGDDAAEAPDLGPECVGPLDRPAVE